MALILKLLRMQGLAPNVILVEPGQELKYSLIRLRPM